MSLRVPLSKNLLASLRDFVIELWPLDGPCSEMHIGDVYVALYFEADGDLGRSAMLWYDRPERLQAVSFFTGSTFDMIVRPEFAASRLAEDMISWAISESKRRNPDVGVIRVQRRPRLGERIAFLESRGFRRAIAGALALEHTMYQLPEPVSLPDAFTCRELSARDVPSRMRAFVNAFPRVLKSTTDYERLMRCNGYNGFLDLVIVDKSDEVAAFCSSWLDSTNRVGLFEPVGTCRRYRRMGLARTLMSEGLRRLEKLGATSAVVRVRSDNAAAIACYQELGFSVVSDTFGFEMAIDAL